MATSPAVIAAAAAMGHEMLLLQLRRRPIWTGLDLGTAAFEPTKARSVQRLKAVNSSSMPAAAKDHHGVALVARCGAAQDEMWWACAACATNPTRWQGMQQLSLPPSAEQRAQLQQLLALPPGLAMQLSALKRGLRVAHRANGFLHANVTVSPHMPLLSAPLGLWHSGMSDMTRQQQAAP
ncbi:hypothetical protein COO60DRAFT_1500389 [Scenedesmus sp. NREL 46B-D3]|nr:hypothetical protein COO60DRAFT_1500389 [Scenedesmus sp. NREL 46B-D3]